LSGGKLRTPLLSAKGDAIVPSTVDVFVNGQPVSSEQVQPGPFEISGIPAVNGAGQMQVVVTDALGRQQVVSQPFYAGTYFPPVERHGMPSFRRVLSHLAHLYRDDREKLLEASEEIHDALERTSDFPGAHTTLTHEHLPDEEARTSHEQGWSGLLDKLPVFLGAAE